MIFSNDIPRFLRDWLLYSVVFSIINFLLYSGEGPEPYLLIILLVAVGVLLAFLVTRCRALVEAWIFRGLLLFFIFLSLWLPDYFGASELEQRLSLIGAITFGTTCAGYKTDFKKRKFS
jgi:hypothetical protein